MAVTLADLHEEIAARLVRACGGIERQPPLLGAHAAQPRELRRRAIHERAGDTQEGSIEVALARLRWAGIGTKAISNTLAQAHLSPVLTAHPTEVQRKSILDAERDIANLLTQRDEIKSRALPKDALAPRELAANEAQMRARVLQLWQTRLLRFTKLTVADEIENALSYYEATFLREIPKIYAELERELGNHPVASFLRMGQWIGGDRDGNPNVSAQTLEYALRRQCEVALRHYLTEVHYLGGELSLSALLVTMGARGALYLSADGAHLADHGTGSSECFVDSVGAGDAFNAVFLLGRLRGWTMERTLARANAFAAASCGYAGAVPQDLSCYARWLDQWSREAVVA